MDESERTGTAGTPVGASGPLVPAELLPVLEQPAKGRPANPLALAVVIVFGLLFACVAWIGLRGLYVDSLERTALAAVEAAVTDDIKALEPVVPAATAASPEFRAALAKAAPPRRYVFSEPVFSSGVSANFSDENGKEGRFLLQNILWPLGELRVEWTGPPFGDGTGRVVMTLEEDGWKVLYITVGKKGISFAPEDAATTFGIVGR